jgi:hypothetical protein
MSWLRDRNAKTDHRWVEERLSAYLDGELPSQEQQSVGRHLATCQACRWQFDTLQQTVQWTRGLPSVPVPRVFTIQAAAQPARPPRRRPSFIPLLQGATALVALLLVVVVAGDIMLAGIMPASMPQQAVMLEQAPADVEVTQVVEVMKEVEAEVAAEEAMPEAVQSSVPEAPLPAAEARAEKAVVAATATAEGMAAGVMAPEPAAEKEMVATAEIGAAELPQAPMLEALEGEADAAVITIEPTPTVLPTVSPTSPPTAVAPTSVARSQEPVFAVPEEPEQRPAEVLRPPIVAWLRAAELVLGIAFVVLGALTIVMIQRYRAR